MSIVPASRQWPQTLFSAILADPGLTSLLDLTQPVAVLLVAVLHFIADAEDPQRVIDTLVAAVPSGSYLVISHFTADSDAKADETGRVGPPGRSLFWCGVARKR